MKFNELSFKNQIFIASLILVIIPITILGISTTNRAAKEVGDKYQQSLTAITNQVNLNLDSLLSDMGRIANLYLINDDIHRALTTNYQTNIPKIALDNTMMKTQINQACHLNTNVNNMLFINKYGFSFEYNITNHNDLISTLEIVEVLGNKARDSEQYAYFGEIKQSKFSGAYNKSTLSMVKVLYEANTKEEIGLFYVGINFDAISNIIEASEIPNSSIIFLNQDNSFVYASGTEIIDNNIDEELLDILKKQSENVNRTAPSYFNNIIFNNNSYTVNIVYNKTTGWKIVHFLNNNTINEAYSQNLQSYFVIFIVSVLFSMLFAALISSKLSKSTALLCKEIEKNQLNNHIGELNINTPILSKELKQVVESYNKLNQYLIETMEQNYSIQINEKQMKIQMLQSQINPHFLYNTLNLISSLANLHDITDIKVISTSMSSMLRYNLKSGPTTRLSDEIIQVQMYMDILKIRFPNKFHFECNISQQLEDKQVPTFILQPILENAVIHGLEEIETEAHICINSYIEANIFHLLISDNGKGMTKNEQDFLMELLNKKVENVHSSIGLLNVQRRIQAFYGNEYGIQINSSKGNGTIIDIVLPIDGYIE